MGTVSCSLQYPPCLAHTRSFIEDLAKGRGGRAEAWGAPKPMGQAARESHQRSSQSNHQNKRRTTRWAFPRSPQIERGWLQWREPSSQDAPVLHRFPTCPIPALPREPFLSTLQAPRHSPSSQGWLEQRWTLDPSISAEVSRESRGRARSAP